MFMSITTIVLVALLMAILIMETALILWMHKTQAKSVEKGHGTPIRQTQEYVDDERFHIAPLGNLDEEYMDLFSNPPMDKPVRRGKSAYLRDPYHERIRQIVNALNIEGVNISSYVDMVLTDHLMRYESQIDHLLHNCYGKSRKLAN